MSTEEGKKKIDPKKLEKQLKFEQKQAQLALQKQNQDQNKEKAEKVEKVEKVKKVVVEEKYVELPYEQAIEQKKNLSQMRDKYEPSQVEAHWDQYWQDNKFFIPSAEEAVKVAPEKKFIMIVPPPNVTGSLHIGHGLTFAIEDSLARQMNGFVTDFVPGTDHAGIATQTVVEKMIWKNEKKTRYDYGREAFLQKVWEWKKIYGDRILMQSKKLGASVDWERLYFTMDQKQNDAVREAFVRLYDQNIIYRSNRLVNWSCKLKTAISDIEVEYQEITEPTKLKIPNHSGEYTFGILQSFAYKVKDEDKELVVATTRIETMLGDVAVAVNSKDPRYKDLIGKQLIHPFIPSRQIKVITDDTLVDMTFGSGAVKITPGHDPNDFECGLRNGLQQINILNDDGEINENGGKFRGMKRYDVRNLLTEELKQLGLYRGEQPNPMRLGFCSKSKDIIEPLMRPQWYIKCKEVADVLIEKVQSKEMQILPEEHEKVWYQWMGNIRDWCISRQIWWGHQCPAYQVSFEGECILEREGRWIIARDQKEALQKAAYKFNKKEEEITLTQDEDVLDTWFSSALLPFSAFGWPNMESLDLKAFFPNTILETGADILFFWVAKMAMMSVMLCGKIPFKTVFLHPMVRDAQGRKMSKSLGNVIDPLEIIYGCTLQTLIDRIKDGNLDVKEQQRSINEKTEEFPNGIQECGSDALRFGLLCYLTQNRSINLDIKRIIGYRNFCNKIWQSFKFVSSKFNNFEYKRDQIEFNQINLLNKWILVKLNLATKSIREGFDNFQLADAANSFHQFWIHDFCDVYIEGTKFIFQDNDKLQVEHTLNVLFCVLETGLRLLHPMMVFLTEELYQKLPSFQKKAKSICVAEYPTYDEKWVCDSTVQNFENIQAIVQKARSLCQSVNLPNSVKPQMFIVTQNNELKLQDLVLKGLSKSSQITYLNSCETIPQGCIIGQVNEEKLYINVKDHIKIDEEVKYFIKQINKMDKKIQDLEKQIGNQQKKMEIKDYDSKTPEEIKIQNLQKMSQYQNEKANLLQQINELKKL